MSSDLAAAHASASHVLDGGGELGVLMRAYDWTCSPLGPVASWPQPLKTLVGVMLAASQPMFVAWGRERTLLYNDAYATLLDGRHPSALGRPVLKVWHDIADEIAPLFEQVFAGEPIHMDDIELRPERPGRPSEAHFAFSYTPVRDETNAIAGLFCVCSEITEQVFADRHRHFMLRIEERLRDIVDIAQISCVASELLGEALGAVRVAYGVIDPQAQAITIGTNWHRPGFADVSGLHRFADYGSHIEDLLAGEVVANVDVTKDPRTAANAAAFAQLGIGAHLDVPIMEDGRAVAEMFVHADQPRRWDKHEIALVRDVTERTRVAIARRTAERDLQNSRLRLANALASARLGTFEWQLETGRVDMDGQARAIFGFSADEPITDRQVFDRIAPDQAGAIEASAIRTVAKGGDYSATYDIELPGGATRHIYSSGVRIEAAGGTFLIGVFQDVTELKTAERAMLRLNETLELRVAERTAERNQLWGMPNLLVATAGADTIIREASPGWGNILGWTQAELTGSPYTDFIHPDDVENTLWWMAGFTAGGPMPDPVNRYRHKDGSYRWIAWTITADDQVFYCVGRDVTDQKAQEAELASAQDALRQSQKMEAVGQLTGGLAHDFNNLLTGMMGNLELLQLRVARGRLDDLDRFIISAQGAGRRAASLTQRLLAFSRRQTLDPKPTDVNRLIAGLQEMLHRTVGATVDIEVVGAAGLWTADIDAGQLENAILNLCINGRDAMPGGGKLTIETANKWLDDHAGRERDLAPGQYISICVTDTGTGMSAETIARAFEPFYTTKPIGQGTGLGLSMIYGFAKQSGGQVRIYSEVGQGTTVCVYLPRHHGDAREVIEGDTHAMAATPAAQTVLVVDDEATIRHLIDEVLDDLGYTVIGAADGAAGIKVLQSGARIELLITDVGLPNGMNGRQVADAARALRPELKVLFITGFAENAAVGNGHLEPGMELLTKPFTLEALSVKVAEMLKTPAA